MKGCYLSFLAIFLFSLVHAQYQLSGIITNQKDGSAMAGAAISLEGTFLGTYTNENGEFKFTKLSKGNYVLVISYLGFETLEKTIEIHQNLYLKLSLKESGIIQDEVIIRAGSVNPKTPATYSNLEAVEIEKINHSKDLPYLLNNIPSIVSTSDAGSGIGYTALRIRGTDMSRINVTLNGIPLNDAESQSVYFVDIPDFSSSIERIQIQRGVGTSGNGPAAFGASINIQSAGLEEKAYAELINSVGSFATLRNTLKAGSGLINDHWTFDVRLSKISSDGYIDRASSVLKSMYLNAAYYGKKSMLKFHVFSGTEKTYQAWNGVPSEILRNNRRYNPSGAYSDSLGNELYYKNETDNYLQSHYQLHYSNKLSPKLYLNTALHLTRGKGYYENYKEAALRSNYGLSPVFTGKTFKDTTDLIQQKWLDNVFYGYTLSLNYDIGKTLKIDIGNSANQYDGDHYGKIIWAEYAKKEDIDKNWYFNSGNKTEFNSFVKVHYAVSNTINLYGDIQYRKVLYKIKGDHDDLRILDQDHSFDFINPKLGIHYEINPVQSIFFSYASSTREPGRNDYRDADKNKEPRAEKLMDYELGYKFQAKKYHLNANAYFMDYDDQLVLTGEINNVGDPVMTNVKRSYRMGIELENDIRIKERISWKAFITLSKNKILDFRAYVDDFSGTKQIEEKLGKTDLSFSPEIISGSTLDIEISKNMHLSLFSKYVGKQYIDNTSSKERMLPSYFVNDLIFSYSFSSTWLRKTEISFIIYNLFQEEYESNAWVYRYYYEGKEYKYDGYFPQALSNYMLTLRIKF